ncbi:MAG: glycosyltransferase [Planctomycetota bacterium]
MSYRILYHHRIRADDGQAVHVRELIGALRRAGHEVRECALIEKAGSETGAAADGNGRAAPAKAGFWQRLQLPRTAIEILEVVYNRRGRAMLRAAARSFRPHFVYERHALHCRAGLDVARELGVPLLLEVNSPMVDEMRKLHLLRLPRMAAAAERAVLGGADRVLAVTRVLADRLQELGAPADRVRVVPNGAVPSRYDAAAHAAGAAVRARWALPADALVLGFVGYMRPWHRLDLVLELMARPRFAALHLVLMGDGPALPALREQAERLGLSARVRCLGVLPPDVLPAHVCAVDAALIPAINGYASPLKLFDTLAAGVPTLAPDQPNLRELVADGDSALLFAPGDGDALAAALLRLLDDRELGPRIGSRGRELLRERDWTWDGNAARVAAIAAELGVEATP